MASAPRRAGLSRPCAVGPDDHQSDRRAGAAVETMPNAAEETSLSYHWMQWVASAVCSALVRLTCVRLAASVPDVFGRVHLGYWSSLDPAVRHDWHRFGLATPSACTSTRVLCRDGAAPPNSADPAPARGRDDKVWADGRAAAVRRRAHRRTGDPRTPATGCRGNARDRQRGGTAHSFPDSG